MFENYAKQSCFMHLKSYYLEHDQSEDEIKLFFISPKIFFSSYCLPRFFFSNQIKKANSFHEPNNINLNRIIINHTQNATDNIKLKLSLNDLTAINKQITNVPKLISNNNNNNNIANTISNNNRMTTSSMSVSTFSPRTTQNNSTIQFAEFMDEKYNRSDYLTNNTNHDFNSNSEMNQTLQQQQHKSLGVSYNNNLNSNSSFLIKSKENILEDNGVAFNKFASKYNTNIAFRSSHSKSPREKKGYLYVRI